MSAQSHAAGDTKLVTMANQIARFFASQPSDEAVSGVETHIRKFWDPRMRAKLRGIVASGGQGLDPCALEAAKRLAD
ncbi:MAG: formate dehydrogenase subunit delta [Proteobacteria bacterium]|nr:formate dehydrogenase subunit delta [Pseudomonadota bacterium]